MEQVHARTQNLFQDRPVDPVLLRKLYELVSCGPTSMNSQPMRAKLLVSREKREALAACVYPGNREKVLSAPVVAVIGMDLNFPATLSKVFPHKTDAAAYYAGNPALVETTAFRNSSMQAAYLIIAARLLSLDCGPMSGFDHEQVDALCWAGTKVKTNLLCNLGYGRHDTVFARSPRHAREEVWHVD
jgi:3-hydroxypropanoate dehydrogenase